MPDYTDEELEEVKRKINRFDAFMVDTTLGKFISAIIALALTALFAKHFLQ
jgi:hypothetical protein